MSTQVKNIIFTVLALLLLVGFALGIPSGTLTQEARQRYLNGTAVSDDFAFEDEFKVLEDEFTFSEDEELIFFEE